NELVNQAAQATGLKANAVCVLAAAALVLAVGSAARVVSLFLMRAGRPEERRGRLGSLVVWWGLLALIVLVALGGVAAAAVVFAAVSLLGLREFRSLARDRVAAVAVWWELAYLAVPAHYAILYFRQPVAFWTFVPIGMLLVLLIRLLLTGRP